MTKGEASTTFVSYLRVSSRAQGVSGLGIEAQRADVQRHVVSRGGRLLDEFVEVESGKRADRPMLRQAMARARASRSTLVVARLDRLSRNVAFLSALMESGVDFVAVDNPHATRFTIHILAAVAELEREMIVKRTKAALQACRARGVKLGSARFNHWQGREEQRLEGSRRGAARAAQVHRRAADAAMGDVIPLLLEFKREGRSLRQMARALNERHVATRRGRSWTATGVRNVLLRLARAGEAGAGAATG